MLPENGKAELAKTRLGPMLAFIVIIPAAIAWCVLALEGVKTGAPGRDCRLSQLDGLRADRRLSCSPALAHRGVALDLDYRALEPQRGRPLGGRPGEDFPRPSGGNLQRARGLPRNRGPFAQDCDAPTVGGRSRGSRGRLCGLAGLSAYPQACGERCGAARRSGERLSTR